MQCGGLGQEVTTHPCLWRSRRAGMRWRMYVHVQMVSRITTRRLWKLKSALCPCCQHQEITPNNFTACTRTISPQQLTLFAASPPVH